MQLRNHVLNRVREDNIRSALVLRRNDAELMSLAGPQVRSGAIVCRNLGVNGPAAGSPNWTKMPVTGLISERPWRKSHNSVSYRSRVGPCTVSLAKSNGLRRRRLLISLRR